MEPLNEFPPGGASAVSTSEGFFEELKKDATWINSWTLALNPSNVIDQHKLTWNIPKLDGDNFPFLQDMKIKLRVQLLDAEGNAPADVTSLAPINNVGPSLFNNVKLFLNETQVSANLNGLYPFWAYINVMANNTQDRKRGIMSLQGFYEDHYWTHFSSRGYSGWDKRRSLFGKVVTEGTQTHFTYDKREATLYADVLTELKGTRVPMLNLVGGRLEVLLNPPTFYLQCDADETENCKTHKYYLKINGAELIIPVKTMAPSLSLKLEHHLKDHVQEYHTVRMDMRKIMIPSGSTSFNTDNIKQTMTSPDRIIFFILPEHVLDRGYGLSPYFFNNYVMAPLSETGEERKDLRAYITNMRLSLNNESLESSETVTTPNDFAMKKLSEFYEVQGMHYSSTGVRLEPADYSTGHFIMIYDLTKSKRAALAGPARQEAKQGALKVEMTFNQPLPNNAYLMVMSEFHSAITVDKNRTVMYRYNN